MGYLVITNGNVTYYYQFRMYIPRCVSVKGSLASFGTAPQGETPLLALGETKRHGTKKKELEHKKRASM
jgi:hypothetical protein